MNAEHIWGSESATSGRSPRDIFFEGLSGNACTTGWYTGKIAQILGHGEAGPLILDGFPFVGPADSGGLGESKKYWGLVHMMIKG